MIWRIGVLGDSPRASCRVATPAADDHGCHDDGRDGHARHNGTHCDADDGFARQCRIGCGPAGGDGGAGVDWNRGKESRCADAHDRGAQLDCTQGAKNGSDEEAPTHTHTHTYGVRQGSDASTGHVAVANTWPTGPPPNAPYCTTSTTTGVPAAAGRSVTETISVGPSRNKVPLTLRTRVRPSYDNQPNRILHDRGHLNGPSKAGADAGRRGDHDAGCG